MEREAAPCDRLRRLLECESVESPESERCADVADVLKEDDEDGDVDDDGDSDDDDDDDDDGRLEALFEAAAAARAACVTGMCIPRLGRDSDLRRVLYGILTGCSTRNGV